jgi:hypothetical protein
MSVHSVVNSDIDLPQFAEVLVNIWQDMQQPKPAEPRDPKRGEVEDNAA